MKNLFLLACALGLALSAQAQPSSVISGTVLDAEEQPLDGAQVRLHPASSREVLRSAEVNAKGVYRLEVDTTGLFMLSFAGANRSGLRVPLLVEEAGRRVEIDAQLSARSSRTAFGDEQSAAARYAQFSAALTERREAFMKQLSVLQRRGAGEEEIEDFGQAYDWSPNRALLEAALKEAEQPSLREALLVTYLSGTLEVDSTYARRALDEIDPTSPLWAARPLALRSALQAIGRTEAYDAYVTKVLSTHANEELNASLLLERLLGAKARNAEDQAGALYERLVTEYPNTLYAESARSRFDPSHAIREGAPVPAFEVASLGQPGRTYSEKSMNGRVYLIDFWATWCGPCITEMPNLHEAYERYNEQGFTILSLSFDETAEAVRDFREVRWAMPWLHAFVQSGVDSEVARAFEVVSIPKPILVNAEGVIVATGRNLRGPNLQSTLARVFGEAPEADE